MSIFNENYYISKNDLIPEIVQDIYSEVKNSGYYNNNANKYLDYVIRNYKSNNRYNYPIDDKSEIYKKIHPIIKSFNNFFRNYLISKNNELIKHKFNIYPSSVEIAIVKPGAEETEIIKNEKLNIFIPLNDISYNNGIVTVINETDKLNINENNNYGFLHDYDEEIQQTILSNEVKIDNLVGDIIFIQANAYTRCLKNDTDNIRACIQLLYDIKK